MLKNMITKKKERWERPSKVEEEGLDSNEGKSEKPGNRTGNMYMLYCLIELTQILNRFAVLRKKQIERLRHKRKTL